MTRHFLNEIKINKYKPIVLISDNIVREFYVNVKLESTSFVRSYFLNTVV